MTAAEARRLRLEEALRTNLPRRKAQARTLDQKDGEAPATDNKPKD